MMNTNKPYRSAFIKSDFASADVVCTAGQYNKLGEFTVPAGLQVANGYGNYGEQQQAVGRIFMDIKNNAASPGADMNGSIRLSVFSAQNRSLVIIDEYRTEALREANRADQIPNPLYKPNEDTIWASEDKKFVLEFIPDVSGTWGYANSTITIDITKRETN